MRFEKDTGGHHVVQRLKKEICIRRKRLKSLLDEAKQSLSPAFLSEEQNCVRECIMKRRNVAVIAKAGSGKTTASLIIAKEFLEKFRQSVLLVTYSRTLKEETRRMINKFGLGGASVRVEAHSIHTLAKKFFRMRHQGMPKDRDIIYATSQEPRRTKSFGRSSGCEQDVERVSSPRYLLYGAQANHVDSG